jgi:hypothetical protein
VGLTAKLLAFTRIVRRGANANDVKASLGGGENMTAEHFSAPGDDSNPLPGDYIALVNSTGSGSKLAVGYLDPKNQQKAEAGEKRIYSRDGDGAQVAEIWLKSDGTLVVNSTGPVEISSPDSSVTVNCSTAVVNSDSIDLGAAGGGGLITTQSIDPFTGGPHIDGSLKVRAAK